MAAIDVIDIRPSDLEIIRAILRRHVSDCEVWAFGSRVHWTAQDHSDLDLAIRSGSPIHMSILSALREDFSESDLPMKVDVLDMARVSENFRKVIEEEYSVIQESEEGSDWKNTTLGALCAVNPDNRGVDWPHSVIQYIDISSIDSGFFSAPPRELSLGEAPSRAQRLVEAEDTIISTVRPNRRSFLFLRCPSPNTVVSTGFCVLRAREGKVDPRFLYYLVTQQSFTDYLVSRAEGSAYPAVNPSVFEEAEIRVPPILEQRAIARILGALDDKIEVNRKMNTSLESIAQALFQSWFVDFDPVHAKSKGRNPGLPSQIADLFPSEFEDSSLGPIPKGWKIGPLSDLAQLRTEAAQPYKSPDELWEHYSIPAYDDSRLPVIESGAGIKSVKYQVPEAAVLISRLNPQFPRVWLPAPSGAHRPICSTELLPFVPRQPDWRSYLYNLALSPPFQAEVANRVTGTTGSRQRVQPIEIAAISLPLPPAPICATFSAMTNPLSNRVQDNRREAQSLSALRDSLLPKLLLGELQA